MRSRIITTAGAVVVAITFAMAVTVSVAAQGKGHGGGGGGGGGRGASGMGQPTGIDVERGRGRSSDASNGRADSERVNASDRSNGRSDDGRERARIARENLSNANRELTKHPGVANALHVNANALRAGYQSALLKNPNLTFGQFVAATRLAHNLGADHPNITRDAILAGLANGKSIGQTLQNLGLSSHEAKDAKKRAEREIEESRK
jgi:hypothetical protein